MRKLSILGLFAALTMIFVSCQRTPGCTDPNSVNYSPDAKKDDGSCLVPEQVQELFICKWTGVNCGPCGSSTTYMNENVEPTYGLSMNTVYMHCQNNDMGLWYNTSLKTIMPTNGGIPKWYLNGNLVYYMDFMDSIPAYLNQTPVGACVGKMSIENDVLKVKTCVKFFDDVEGSYELGVYVTQNGIPATNGMEQSGGGTDFIHDHAFRYTMNSGSVGDDLTNQSIRKDYGYFQEYEVAVDPDWVAEDLEVILVLWKAGDNLTDYVYINSNTAEK